MEALDAKHRVVAFERRLTRAAEIKLECVTEDFNVAAGHTGID